MTDKLSERLLAHADAHAASSPYDDEQWLWEADLRRASRIVRAFEDAPEAIMDTRDVLGICAPTEEDFPALYAIQGRRVKLVEVKRRVYKTA